MDKPNHNKKLSEMGLKSVGIVQRSNSATIHHLTGFQGLGCCETVLQYGFDWRHLCAMADGYARISRPYPILDEKSIFKHSFSELAPGCLKISWLSAHSLDSGRKKLPQHGRGRCDTFCGSSGDPGCL